MPTGKQHYGIPNLVDVPVVADPTAATATALVDQTNGSASATLGAPGAEYSAAEVANLVASLAAQINALIADVGALRTNQKAITDALQALGLATAS